METLGLDRTLKELVRRGGKISPNWSNTCHHWPEVANSGPVMTNVGWLLSIIAIWASGGPDFDRMYSLFSSNFVREL